MHFTTVLEGAGRLPEGLPEAVQETSGAGRLPEELLSTGGGLWETFARHESIIVKTISDQMSLPSVGNVVRVTLRHLRQNGCRFCSCHHSGPDVCWNHM